MKTTNVTFSIYFFVSLSVILGALKQTKKSDKRTYDIRCNLIYEYYVFTQPLRHGKNMT